MQKRTYQYRLSTVIPFIAASFVAVAPASFAQDQRVEINPFFGYTLSDGVTIDPVSAGGETYDAVNAKSGVGYGIHFGVFVTEQVEVGFLWAREDSVLQGEGTTTTDFTDMSIDNYIGTVTYNFGDDYSQARPFIIGGIGASSFAPSDIDGQSIDSVTKFTGTFGGGVKVYPNPRIGFTAMARWTPNYIKSDPDGVWCSPYWFYGCYVLSDAQYANQLELTGGLSLRF